MRSMPNTILPVELEIGGSPKQVNVIVVDGPGAHEVDTTSVLLVFSPDPSTASISTHPNPERTRSVIVTPGFIEGTVTCLVTSDPPSDDNLEIEITNITPPPRRRILPDAENPVVSVEP
jgi:hypothetical protein